MRYTVTWLPPAIDELADLWLVAPDPQAVTEAADRLELALVDDPESKSVPFYGDWLLIDPPLAVVFAVDPGDCKVEVQAVWHQ